MKKSILLVITTLLLAIGAAGIALAAATLDVDNIRSTETGRHMIVPIAAAGDTNSVTINIAAHPYLEGRLLYGIESEPGTGGEQPSAAYDVTVASGHWSLTWSSLSNAANDAKSFNEATGDITNYQMVTGNVSVAIDDLGAGNTAVINLIFW